MGKNAQQSVNERIFELANKLSHGDFWWPGSEADRKELENLLSAYIKDLEEGSLITVDEENKEQSVRGKVLDERIEFLFTLTITCPDLVDYEWFRNQLKRELLFLKNNSRRLRASGRPSDIVSDWQNFKKVLALMKKEKRTKTRAMEIISQENNISYDALVKSIKRFEKKQKQDFSVENKPFYKITKKNIEKIGSSE